MGSSEPSAFAAAVRQEFGFLEEMGFVVVQELDRLVRYQPDEVVVAVYLDRGCELDVTIGLRSERGIGRRPHPSWPLASIVRVEHDPDEIGVHTIVTSKPRLIPGFVHDLAGWTRDHAQDALRGDPRVFAQVSANNTVWFEAVQARGVRQRAERAWHARDWAGVVEAYREIIADLPTVELRPSERARLRYASARLDDSHSSSG